ncbi:hypothetical protein TRAPUB_14282 [Trametes pubescens]|uniref:Uncharacterized protein n=1 Tax=Trametes pubescens TaxID=154538 RepID=A0A1M2VNV8_TRAPU|nr:hypothetical protein TRAPUB_14282 [Trametes pubescens]
MAALTATATATLAGLAGDSLLLPLLFLRDMTRLDRSQRTIPSLESTSKRGHSPQGLQGSQQAPTTAHPE